MIIVVHSKTSDKDLSQGSEVNTKPLRGDGNLPTCRLLHAAHARLRGPRPNRSAGDIRRAATGPDAAGPCSDKDRRTECCKRSGQPSSSDLCPGSAPTAAILAPRSRLLNYPPA